MRFALIAAAVGLVGLAHAGKVPPSRVTLVQATCRDLATGSGTPCSPSFRFATGTATLKSAREPGPTCPKTGDPSESSGGDARLTGVTKGGAAFTGSLPMQVVLKTTFGSDPNGNCELQNVQVDTLSLMGTLDCKNGKCKGTLHPIACLPKQCADTPITSEFSRVQVGAQSFGPLLVLDDAGLPLATPGTTVAPGAEP